METILSKMAEAMIQDLIKNIPVEAHNEIIQCNNAKRIIEELLLCEKDGKIDINCIKELIEDIKVLKKRNLI